MVSWPMVMEEEPTSLLADYHGTWRGSVKGFQAVAAAGRNLQGLGVTSSGAAGSGRKGMEKRKKKRGML